MLKALAKVRSPAGRSAGGPETTPRKKNGGGRSRNSNSNDRDSTTATGHSEANDKNPVTDEQPQLKATESGNNTPSATVSPQSPPAAERTGSSDGSEDEPWDVVLASSEDASTSQGGSTARDSTTTATPKEKDPQQQPSGTNDRNTAPTSDVGDLPSLSNSKRSASLTSGQRTIRPLSPPSQAGLPPKTSEQQHTAQQKDTPLGVEDDEEDMPMDEKMDHRRRRQEALLCMDTDPDGTGIAGADLCDTMTSISELCGLSPTQSPEQRSRKHPGDNDEEETVNAEADPETKETSTSRRKKKKKESAQDKILAAKRLINSKKALERLDIPKGVEEQTAIEVEYVEPIRTKSSPATKSSPSAKSMESSGSAGNTKKNAMLKALSRKAKQDYETNKKKSPDDEAPATERSVAAADSDAANTPDNVYSTLNPSEKRKFLKLINSGMTPSDATQQVLDERVADKNDDGEKAVDSSSSKSSKTLLGSIFKRGQKDQSPKEAAQRSRQKPDDGTSVSDSMDESTDGTNSALGGFAKSGINYYDAVRQESNDSFTEDSDRTQNTPRSSSGHSNSGASASGGGAGGAVVKAKNLLPKFGKSGFAKMGDEENSADNGQRSRGLDLSTESAGVDSAENTSRQQQQQQRMSPVRPPMAPKSHAEPKSVEEARAMAPPPPPPPQKAQDAPQDVAQDVTSPPRTVNTASSPDETSNRDDSIFKPVAHQGEAGAVAKSYSADSLLDGDPEDDKNDTNAEAGQRGIVTADDNEIGAEEKKDDGLAPVVTSRGVLDLDGAESTGSVEEKIANQLLNGAERNLVPLQESEDEQEYAPEDDANEQDDPQEVNRQRSTSMELEALDLETYMNSTELFSAMGNSTVAGGTVGGASRGGVGASGSSGASTVAGDHVSVVSGRSHRTIGTAYTNYTTGTNYTASTRSRRPGAAKNRMQIQKTTVEKSKKRRGWQESIQAAAASTNRVWDPAKGWVDYVDPDKVVVKGDDNAASAERIHVDVSKIKSASTDGGDVAEDPAAEPTERQDQETVSVPFPEEWKAQRSAMMGESTPDQEERALPEQAPVPSGGDSVAPSVAASASGASIAQRKNLSPRRTRAAAGPVKVQAAAAQPSKPRGWVETMKAATANLNLEGKKWDPDRGWVGLDDSTVASLQEDRYAGSVAEQGEGDTADFGTGAGSAPAPGSAPGSAPAPAPGSAPVYAMADGAGAKSRGAPATADEVLAAVGEKPDPQGHVLTFEDEASADSGEYSRSASVKSGRSGRYVQIGDTGSVISHYRNPGQPSSKSQKPPQSNSRSGGPGFASPKTPLPATLPESPEGVSEQDPPTPENNELFGKLEDASKEHRDAQKKENETGKRPSLMVDVVKEKVDPADAGSLFPASARRTTGPIDLDELHDQEYGSFEAAPSDFSWDENDQAAASRLANGQPQSSTRAVPRLKINMRDTPPKEGGQTSTKSSDNRPPGEKSFDTTSSGGAKSVPKLRGPPRDTSPIRGRRSTRSKNQPPQPEVVSAERQKKSLDDLPDDDPLIHPLSKQGTSPPVPVRSVKSRDIPVQQYDDDDDEEDAFRQAEKYQTTFQESPVADSVSHRGPSPPMPMRSVQSRSIPIGSSPPKKTYPPHPERSVRSRDSNFTPDRSSNKPLIPGGRPSQYRSPQNRGTPSRSPADGSNPNLPDSPSGSSVRMRAQFFESRSSGSAAGSNAGSDEFNNMPPQTAEWKSFLAKKVRAESEAAANDDNRRNSRKDEERDSIFDFGESDGAFPSNTRRSAQRGMVDSRQDMPQQNRHNTPNPKAFESISDLSPIRMQGEDDADADADDEAASEVVAPSEGSSAAAQPTTFLERLTACAAPMMPTKSKNLEPGCNPLTMSQQLSFLRSNATVNPEKEKGALSRKSNPALCGFPDVITEEEEEFDVNGVRRDKEPETRQREERSRSRSRSNPRSSRQSDVSSVISDEAFGAKTAYFEALAMKAAVSGSKAKKKRQSNPDSASSASGSSKHSEQWQRFMEKKKLGNSPRNDSEDSEEVTKLSEKYAAEKVEEMMDVMSRRSQSTPAAFESRPMEEATGAFPSLPNKRYPPYMTNQTESDRDQHQSRRQSDSARAAEELAAARVEAMMHALSGQTLEEAEI